MTDKGVVDVLAEASWREADAALAEAWRDLHVAEALAEKIRRGKIGAQVLDEVRAIAGSVARACRRRGLEPEASIGDVAPFDPDAHEDCNDALADGEMARIVAPGVRRRIGRDFERLVRARVARIEVDPPPEEPNRPAIPKPASP